PRVLLAEQPDPLVTEKRPYDLGGPVGRAVVDDDQLEGVSRLRENRPDRRRDGRRRVVRGHRDGERRLHHETLRPQPWRWGAANGPSGRRRPAHAALPATRS